MVVMVVVMMVIIVVSVVVDLLVMNWDLVVSRLCYVRRGIVVVVGGSDDWIDVVLLCVLVLSGVSRFIVG